MQTQTANHDRDAISIQSLNFQPQAFDMPSPISDARIAALVAKGIDQDIAEIDLEMVKMKLGEPKEGIGWNSAQLEDAEIEYKRYLMLCRKFPHPNYAIVPNKIMDTTWHYHILDTRAYCQDSEKLFGGYFHHFPYFGMRGDEDAAALKSSFEETKILYQKTFGESMDHSGDAGDCWNDCKGRCWNACKN